jgi:hypothetical protein
MGERAVWLMMGRRRRGGGGRTPSGGRIGRWEAEKRGWLRRLGDP